MNYLDIALAYYSYGLTALPVVKGEKRPAVKRWREYQKVKPTQHEIENWNWEGGVGLLTGQISGGLEVLDFDNKGNIDATTLLHRFYDLIYEESETLAKKLVLERSPSGGFHIFYTCAQIEGNQKLAKDQNNVVLIETRGEGGFIVVNPTVGYEIWADYGFSKIPLLLPEERNILIRTAKLFDQKQIQAAKNYETTTTNHHFKWTGKTPFQDFNEQSDVLSLLSKHDFTFPYRTNGGKTIAVKRNGTKAKHSGYYFSENKLLYLFSTSTVFEAERAYDPSGVFITLECNGDAKKAFKELYQQGYGARQSIVNGQNTQNIQQNKSNGLKKAGTNLNQSYTLEAQLKPKQSYDVTSIQNKKEYFERQYEFFQKKKREERKVKEVEEQNLLQKAIAEVRKNKFDYHKEVESETPIFFIKSKTDNYQPVAGLGQIVGFVGKQKSRKTTALRAAVGSALTGGEKELINFKIVIPRDKNILDIDTEQDETAWNKSVKRMVRQAGFSDNPSRYHAYNLRPYSKVIRMKTIDYLVKNTPNLGLIIIDGVVDICDDFNQVKASETTIDKLMYWCSGEGRKALLLTVLHLNKGDFTTIRGHLGTTLQNKANAIIEVEKIKETPDYSKIKCRDIRSYKAFEAYDFTQNERGFPVLDPMEDMSYIAENRDDDLPF